MNQLKTNKFLVYMLIVLVVLVVSAVVLQTKVASNDAKGIANPASVHCEQKGGKLDFRTLADGSQSGMCVFPDGSECEEWAFFRGECNPGTGSPNR